MSRFRIYRRVALAGACAATVAVAFAGSAHPATPSSGKLSKATPRVTWNGSLTSSGIFYTVWDQDNTLQCMAPLCDTYNLDLSDGPTNITIGLNVQSGNAAGGDPGCGLRIHKPDATYVWKTGTCGVKPTLAVKIKGAANGAYVIDSVSSHVCCGSEDYKAFAEIDGLVPVEGAEPPAATPATSATEDFKLTVKAPKISARKAKKGAKFGVAVTTSKPVKQVTARLTAGKKVVGQGSKANFSGKGKVTLRLTRKLKKGSYKLTIVATDGQINVSKTVTVRVR